MILEESNHVVGRMLNSIAGSVEVASHTVVVGYLLFNLDDSGVLRLGLNVLLNVLFLGEVILT